jgi:hypothetical protein
MVLIDSTAKTCGAVVHIYSKENRPEYGYRGYLIKERRKNKLRSTNITEAISAAEANDLGTLGEGILRG